MHLIYIIILAFVVGGAIFLTCKANHQEHMRYLDQYETQDNYRNVPESWPVVYTSTTALYAAKRKYLEELLSQPPNIRPGIEPGEAF
jgi:hypothetical protein